MTAIKEEATPEEIELVDVASQSHEHSSAGSSFYCDSAESDDEETFSSADDPEIASNEYQIPDRLHRPIAVETTFTRPIMEGEVVNVHRMDLRSRINRENMENLIHLLARVRHYGIDNLRGFENEYTYAMGGKMDYLRNIIEELNTIWRDYLDSEISVEQLRKAYGIETRPSKEHDTDSLDNEFAVMQGMEWTPLVPDFSDRIPRPTPPTPPPDPPHELKKEAAWVDIASYVILALILLLLIGIFTNFFFFSRSGEIKSREIFWTIPSKGNYSLLHHEKGIELIVRLPGIPHTNNYILSIEHNRKEGSEIHLNANYTEDGSMDKMGPMVYCYRSYCMARLSSVSSVGTQLKGFLSEISIDKADPRYLCFQDGKYKIYEWLNGTLHKAIELPPNWKKIESIYVANDAFSLIKNANGLLSVCETHDFEYHKEKAVQNVCHSFEDTCMTRECKYQLSRISGQFMAITAFPNDKSNKTITVFDRVHGHLRSPRISMKNVPSITFSLNLRYFNVCSIEGNSLKCTVFKIN